MSESGLCVGSSHFFPIGGGCRGRATDLPPRIPVAGITVCAGASLYRFVVLVVLSVGQARSSAEVQSRSLAFVFFSE